ncbi:kinesin-like protein KIN-12D isoform X1 [Arachis duranensis]|uniref:Kinesin-like protein KIN-12D isoform X1 n=2 Tax=Arachis duranensis TaxID=130453 RepID=A0A6P4BXI5_ARADU|nr:kinesin-like protein KIN-12D isoform X1 [Arachis duranensis]
MLRDSKLTRRNPVKNEEIENVDPSDSASAASSCGEGSRPPLNTIQEGSSLSKIERTPSKLHKARGSDPPVPFRTPDKHAAGGSVLSKNRFGWNQKNDAVSMCDERRGSGAVSNVTPRVTRTGGRAAAATTACSESNSVQSTPTKSVTKPPPSSSVRSKADGSFSARLGSYISLYKGVPSSAVTPMVINTIEVPHFDLKEDPSFWINHNVQVIIRVRPLNSMERSMHGYNRCLKQESAQCITWVGQPESRFTFDHVACETVDQEMIFRMAGLPMVENCLSGYNSCMFAYGQTGSGKTHTMLGDIEDLDVKPSPHRGMTPRIFEFLFARIQAEEESRRDENLKYNCKCSFLEIYNEQITDLLDPSSTNLLLREDVKRGVYVENLSEFEVQSVNDILRLLIQGSANRKVAATNMNRESSRSHSVFTCVIESTWEKDSTTNYRFARLNLVDLAGSERQKTSGAEGERLKEAANINKSLSTLGHVIMILVDVANGKQRHIPYRDSRLTFLLQDSLGGNSKTMIIANVSPSICCAAETLNTLKFAQRAKLIQNNAVVNEDSSGDVIALQHQIRLLKEELSTLKRCQNVSRSLSFSLASARDIKQSLEECCVENASGSDMDEQDDDDNIIDCGSNGIRMSFKQLESLESTLAGALRREQMAEASVKQLEAEIEQLNYLVRQREEDARSCKMMLRFREDKIRRLESQISGSMPTDAVLLEENKALSDEIQILKGKLERNPEVTRFAVENIRLLDQLKRYQEFYEEREREILLAEVSTLRDQLLQFHGRNSILSSSNYGIEAQKNHCCGKEKDSVELELKKTRDELQECKRNLNYCLEENTKLSRELESLYPRLTNINATKDSTEEPLREAQALSPKLEGNPETHTFTEDILNLQLELDIMKIILKEERTFRALLEEQKSSLKQDLQMEKDKLLLKSKLLEDSDNELKEAKSVIEALESQQILSIQEIEEMRNKNNDYLELMRKQECEIRALKNQFACKELRDNLLSNSSEIENESPLQVKLKRMHDSLEKAKQLNIFYQRDHALQISNEEEMDEVRRQAEAETVEVIVRMQEELAKLQHEVHDNRLKETKMRESIQHLETELKEVQERLLASGDDNQSLREELVQKDIYLRSLAEEWELLTSEIGEILSDGFESLLDASDELVHISNSFPDKRIWISEQVGMIVRKISEKELLIDELRRCLEDASNKRSDMECMLKSLRSAAMVITEAHQKDSMEKEKEVIQLTSDLSEKTFIVTQLEEQLITAENHFRNAANCATAAFVVVDRMSDVNLGYLKDLKHKDTLLSELAEANSRKDALLAQHSASLVQAETQVTDLQERCNQLLQKLSEEQEHSFALEQKLEDIEKSAISKTREQLATLRDGVSSMRSCMASIAKPSGNLDNGNSMDVCTSSCDDNDEIGASSETHRYNNSGQSYAKERLGHLADLPSELVTKSGHDNQKSRRVCKDACERDVTITLLRKEIECALESLKQVQDEMARLHAEKKEMSMSEKQSRQSVECLKTQILSLQATMINFEEHSKAKLDILNHKLRDLENSMKEAGSHWNRTKEWLEHEVGEANTIRVQKASEASCILAKFEEAQDAMREANGRINELMITNESMKLDIERLKGREVTLLDEKGSLIIKVECLQAVVDTKHQEIENLVESNLLETKNLIVELDDAVKEVQLTIKEIFMSLASDLHCIKSQFLYSTKFVQPWLEKIWSEIVLKDSAISVLHLCHMGILLETVTGMHAENGLLSHGLSESNSIVSDLKEHNFRTKQELDMCRVLKGKLLADIKHSFDRISRKEEEAGEITLKLNTFAKNISDLQLQEEMMLQRSNEMGSQLAILMRDLDMSNNDAVISLLDQEKELKQKVEAVESEAEYFMEDWYAKDFESLIHASELKDMSHHLAHVEENFTKYSTLIEHLKKETIFSQVGTELADQILMDKEVEFTVLEGEVQQRKVERQDLLVELNQNRLKIAELGEIDKALAQNIECLKNATSSNIALKGELSEVKEENKRLWDKVQDLEADYDRVIVDLIGKEVEVSFLKGEVQHARVEREGFLMELNLNVSRIAEMGEINKALELNIEFLKDATCSNNALKREVVEVKEAKQRLQVKILDLEADYDKVIAALIEKDVASTCSFHHISVLEHQKKELMKVNSTLEDSSCNFQNELSLRDLEITRMQSLLQVEVSRKDDVIKGLLYDMSLLQESASNSKDQKDEIDDMMARMESLEAELALKSGELADAVSNCQLFEAKLQEKSDIITALELDLSKEREALKLQSRENQDLRTHIEDSLATRKLVDDELKEKRKITESLEDEILEMSSVLGEMNDTIKNLSDDLDEVAAERDQLQGQIICLKQSLEKAEAEVEANAAVAQEAQKVAETRKVYAKEKEAEVKLLERSVEELESIVNVLENKVDIIKGEAQRQRLQREDLELELHALKDQMQNVRNADTDMKRFLDEKEKSLEEALNQILVLKRDLAGKNEEIVQMKAHISELNLHAEAQAKEYKQKFKALEAMVEQVKPEELSTQSSCALPNKSEKNASKSRGSSSPFKCIGLGLAQQIKYEKVEELSAARLRIEELEAQAACRQKEIFALNARLAAAESMTHDVIRDLLGVKLDMTSYVSLLDNGQVQKIAEEAQFHTLEPQEKEQEVTKLKKQLNEFIEERQGWLREMEKKQAEIVAAQIALENLRQREQLLKTENEMLKMENLSKKNKVMELEEEIKKLSGQQNLQQRIHHHAKIKEENNRLKLQNEELSANLRKANIFVSRVKEDFGRLRASAGAKPCFDFNEEQRLMTKLKEIEEEKVQLAQQLLRLSTNVLKAAGFTKRMSEIDPSLAEEALEELKNRIANLEMQQEDLKFKNKIIKEKVRLSELMPHVSPLNSRPDENHATTPPRTSSQAPFLSSFDR